MESKKIQYLQNVTQLFDTAWFTYKKHFKNILKINAVPAVIAVCAGVVFKYADFISDTTPVSFLLGIQLVTLVCSTILVAMVAGSLSYIAQVRLVSGDVYVSLKKAFSESVPYLYGYLLLMIYIGVSVFFGALLLIVPGIVFAIWFMFAPMVMVVDRIKGISALKKSKSLVRGVWGNVFLRILALMALSLLLSIAAGVFVDFIQKLFSVSELSAQTIVDFLYQLIVTPFGIIYVYELYRNLVDADRKASPVQESSPEAQDTSSLESTTS